MKKKMSSGTWLVIGLLGVGLIAALIGLKFRRFPEEWKPVTRPSTRSTTR